MAASVKKWRWISSKNLEKFQIIIRLRIICNFVLFIPSIDVIDVGHQEIEIPGLQSSGQLLELSHYLDPAVNATQGLREVAHG